MRDTEALQESDGITGSWACFRNPYDGNPIKEFCEFITQEAQSRGFLVLESAFSVQVQEESEYRSFEVDEGRGEIRIRLATAPSPQSNLDALNRRIAKEQTRTKFNFETLRKGESKQAAQKEVQADPTTP